MDKKDIKILEEDGWDVVCEHPFELEMWSDDKKVMIGEAKGEAARIILANLKMKYYL
jgi:hypothetical protein